MRNMLSRAHTWLLAAVLGFHAALSVAAVDHGSPISLQYEHPGDLFSKVSSGSCCVNGVVQSGQAVGQTKEVGGVSTYFSYPPGNKTDVAVLYLTDVFGLALVNNKLLGDSIAKAGYFVVMPDLFKGDPVPADAMSGGNTSFNMTKWRGAHTVAVVDGIIESTIKSMRGEFGVKKIGAVGYCFGGKYVARFLAQGKGLDSGFTAHPSGIETAELQAVNAPFSIAYAETDQANPPAKRHEAEDILQKKGATYQTSLYAGAEHGFAVRTNVTDRRKKFAQEAAYFQAVKWFDEWIKA